MPLDSSNTELKDETGLMLTLATIASVASLGFIATPNAAESVGGVTRGAGTPSSLDVVPVRASGLPLNTRSTRRIREVIYRIYIRRTRPDRICRFGAVANGLNLPRPLTCSTIGTASLASSPLREHRMLDEPTHSRMVREQ